MFLTPAPKPDTLQTPTTTPDAQFQTPTPNPDG